MISVSLRFLLKCKTHEAFSLSQTSAILANLEPAKLYKRGKTQAEKSVSSP